MGTPHTGTNVSKSSLGGRRKRKKQTKKNIYK